MSPIKRKNLSIIGLIISSLGAFISSLSFTEYLGSSITSNQTGIKYHPAFISSYGFKIGLFIMIWGFAFQIAEKLYKKETIPYKDFLITFLSIAVIFFVLAIILNFILFR